MRAETLLAGREKVSSLEPLVERHMAALEYGPDLDGELLAALGTGTEAWAGRLALDGIDALRIGVAALRANRAGRPYYRFKAGDGGGFIVEVRLRKDGHGLNPCPYGYSSDVCLSKIESPNFIGRLQL